MNGKLRREYCLKWVNFTHLFFVHKEFIGTCIHVCNTYYTMCHPVYPLDIALKKYYHRNTIKSI